MRGVYFGMGMVFFVLAVLGAMLPVLPTTPFVLLTSWCLIRSSPTLHERLQRSRLFGRLLLDWERHRGVRLPVKVTALSLLVIMVGASLWLGNLSPGLTAALLVLAAAGAVVLCRLRTIVD